jgi:glycosyltransferase involved in cell wall biosynthesis
MLIVHLAAYYSPHVGGVEKHLQKLAAALQKKGHTSVVITQQFESTLPQKERLEEVEIRRLRVFDQLVRKHPLWYKLRLWAGMWQLLPLLKKADVIHIHDVFFWIIPFLPFLSRKKMYITFHGYEAETPGFWARFWHRLAHRLCRGSLAIGGFHRKWYGVEPTATSFGAVEGGSSSKESLVRRGRHSKVKKLIFAGRLAEDVGIMMYLQALRLLMQRDEKYQLDVFGEGPLGERAKKYVKKYQLPVNFHPFAKDIDSKFSGYDVVLVSRYLAIIEALASGTPVVACYNSEIKRDYLQQSPFAGWISISNKPSAIASAIERLAKAGSLSSKAVSWANSQTWKVMAQQYLNLWRS